VKVLKALFVVLLLAYALSLSVIVYSGGMKVRFMLQGGVQCDTPEEQHPIVIPFGPPQKS
jgi:hypothetical protein